jgi:inner membrane protein
LTPVLITSAAVLFFVFLWRLPARWRLGVTLGTASSVVLLFAQTSSYVRGKYESLSALQFPRSRLDDVVLSPMPANPFCWTVTSVEIDESDDRYVSRRAIYAPFPRLVEASACQTLGNLESRAPTQSDPATPFVHWIDDTQMPLERVRDLARSSCQFSSFLKFARVPTAELSGAKISAGDLRFRWRKSGDFSDFMFTEGDPCLGTIPPWEPPRKDLLGVTR